MNIESRIDEGRVDESRIVELETRLSYQDYIIQELNDVVVRQQDQIDALLRDFKRVRDHLKERNQSEISRPEEDVPPPHY